MFFQEMPLDLKIELILIGDELLNGHKKDANLNQLTQFLSLKGLSLSFVQLVGDKSNHIESAFQLASSRSQIIISSGGLGPTLDDLTKEALSVCFGIPLEFSNQAKQVTVQNYQRHNRESKFEINRYDHIPQGTIALNNAIGFAPGIFYQDQKKSFNILLAPGVPKEFKAMIEEHLEKLLSQFSNVKSKKQLLWRTYGIAEEKIFSDLCPKLWEQLAGWGNVSSLPHLFGVDVGLSVDEAIYQSSKDKIQKIIDDSGLSPHIWIRENISLAEYIVKLAHEKKITFSFVESCTGGFASHLITQIPGSSAVFKGSLITYQTEVKNNFLGIDKSITLEHGVNLETANQMSQKGLSLLGADYCISFTGFAGPTGGDLTNPLGRVWISLSEHKNKSVLSKKLDFIGTRQERIERFAFAGLHFLRQELEKLISL